MMNWAKIMYSDFIDHFAALDDKQIVKDVRKSIEDLAEGNSRGKSFGAFIVKSSIERISKVSKQNKVNGSKGGLATSAARKRLLELANRNLNSGKPTHNKTNDPTLTVPTAGGSCGEISDAASKSTTSCDTLTADGDIREDSHAKTDGSAITRNETRHIDALDSSANHYATRQAKKGDAATREGADVSTTFSKNTRQSAKTRDNSDDSRCRYAPPSCSPEDGNHYDQDTSISTDNPQPEGLTGPTAGGSCVEISDAATTSCASTISTNPSQEAPTRKAGDELTESGNGSLRNTPSSCEEHLDEARESQRTGAAPERVKNQPLSHCGKAPVRSFGESGLVHMTDAQANSLRSYYGEDFDRAVGILENYILSLPSKEEGDEKCEAKFWREDYAKRNHYFAMRRDNWVDNALKKAKTAEKRLENASNPNYKSFKQQDLDARTEFFSKSIFDGKEAI